MGNLLFRFIPNYVDFGTYGGNGPVACTRCTRAMHQHGTMMRRLSNIPDGVMLFIIVSRIGQ